MHFIPYGRQDITDEDIKEVVKTLKADFITQGPKIDEFEEALANSTGARFATAVSNATNALHLACLSLGVGNGDIVWTSPITFVASANCALYCGADIDFVDIDPKSFNMSPVKLREKLGQAKLQGCIPKVVICVHMAGQSCEMKEIREITEEYGVKVIEDASHAIGGSYLETKVGSCKYSDISIFSFHPVKIITTGEGGCLLTNDERLNQKIKRLRTHGITKNPEEYESGINYGPWYHEQQDLGYNYRITDIQAALGSSQLKRLDSYIGRRNEIAKTYNNLFAGSAVISPEITEGVVSAFHLYIIQFDLTKTDRTHKEIFSKLREKNIGVNLHYYPVHLQPYYRKLGFKEGDFEEAERYYKRSISLPIFPTITDQEVEYIADSLKEIIK